MPGYDFTKPFEDTELFPHYVALNRQVAAQYGSVVRAFELSNAEYQLRFNKLAEVNNMQPPPSHARIFPGYLVVRKLGAKDQYETWMPDHVFSELYGPKTD
jgi:hypothetical protein